MPTWLLAVFSLTVLAGIVFIIGGVISIIRTRGRLLRPWLLVAVGTVVLVNVYLLTAPIKAS